ncbi:pyridine nucleotide-disulfide oxidoreductase [ANME-1 cluster archaeon AG-394-G21]|nr:pyridine nucleotide-disulfide oxidoreductase [ANME-1 cluster archaeon AG-394-G21]
MTDRVLVLGAGAAGSVVTNKVAREFRQEIAKDEVEITILDKNDMNINQGGFTFIPFGLYTPEDIMRPRKKVISPRVKTAFGEDGEVEHVDLGNREVTAKSGKKYPYDYLVLATGCRADVGSVPGLSNDFNTFYTSLEDAFKLGESVKSFNKGRIVIMTPQMPIPCPGAPGKFTILLDSYLRYVRGDEVRKEIEISLLWPTELLGPQAYDDVATPLLEKQNIKVVKNFGLSEVDEGKKEVVASNGERTKYDLLITIPPHKCTPALVNSEITDEKGWIPINKNTLQYQGAEASYDEVYALGDAGPAEIIKTGIGTHYQSLIAGQNVINDIRGNGEGAKVTYMGEMGCPLVSAAYTPSTRGEAYIPTWSYGRPLEPFKAIRLGWFLYRMYYYIYWDAGLKALM